MSPFRPRFLRLLQKLQSKFHLTYLFISHDLNVVGHISQRVAVMYLGRIVELASREEIFQRPLHPYTQVLLKAIPQPDPSRGKITSPLTGELPSLFSPPGGCPFVARCPQFLKACRVQRPALTEVSSEHFVACLKV